MGNIAYKTINCVYIAKATKHGFRVSLIRIQYLNCILQAENGSELVHSCYRNISDIIWVIVISKLYMQGQQQVKVIVLGDSGVGKSCLLLRFVNNQFNEYNEPTLGAAFLSKLHDYGNGKSVRFQVWDTAGQEKYKSIASIYYRDAQVALCVYDITNKHSFQVLKNWVEELKSKGPANIVLAVVGNKIDRADDEQIPYNEAKQYSQSIGAIFKLTSAKEGKGVNELFTSIAERLEEIKANNTAAANRQTTQLTSKSGGKEKKGCCGKNG